MDLLQSGNAPSPKRFLKETLYSTLKVAKKFIAMFPREPKITKKLRYLSYLYIQKRKVIWTQFCFQIVFVIFNKIGDFISIFGYQSTIQTSFLKFCRVCEKSFECNTTFEMFHNLHVMHVVFSMFRYQSNI